MNDPREARRMHDCPRCRGTLIKSGDDVSCLACGWDGYPRPEAIALRMELMERPDRRREPRRAGRAI
jgi:hypothetical protein